MSTAAPVDARSARRRRLMQENIKPRTPTKSRHTLRSEALKLSSKSPKSTSNVQSPRPVIPSLSGSPSLKETRRIPIDDPPPISPYSSFGAGRTRSSSLVDDDMPEDEKKVAKRVEVPSDLFDQPTLDPVTPETSIDVSTDISTDILEDEQNVAKRVEVPSDFIDQPTSDPVTPETSMDVSTDISTYIVPESPKQDPPALNRSTVDVSLGKDRHEQSGHPPSGRNSPNLDSPDRNVSIISQTQSYDSLNQDAEMLSVGGAEDHSIKSSAALIRLSKGVKALQEPKNMTDEEKELWDTIHSRLETMKTESQARRVNLENELQQASAKLIEAGNEKEEMEKKIADANKQIAILKRSKAVSSMFKGNENKIKELERSVLRLECRLKEAREDRRLKEEEHERNIQAIQRVLADTNMQNESMVNELNSEIEKVQKEKQQLEEKMKQSDDVEILMSLRAEAKRASELEKEMETLKRTLEENEHALCDIKADLTRKNGKISLLEKELTTVKEKLDVGSKIEEDLTSSLKDREEKLEKLQNKVAILMPNGNEDTANVESLVSEVEEKKASLNMAKSIIASLENANNSLATELRGKLKEKNEIVDQLKGELSYKKRTLDQLAIEMRSMQSRRNTGLTREQVKELAFEQRTLRNKLESALSELRSVAAVHEAAAASGSQDSDVIEQISGVLSQSLETLEATRLVSETTVNDSDQDEDSSVLSMAETDLSSTIGGTRAHDLSHHLSSIIQNDAAKELLGKLEQEKATVDRLQEKVRLQTLEIDQLRSEVDCTKEKSKKTEEELNAKIINLESNCRTNFEVLMRKERELAVLRDSLDIVDVGYISDASDGDEEDIAVEAILAKKPLNIDSSEYSHSKAEAVATLLAQGGGLNIQKKLNKALKEKEVTEKELKKEKAALANAKMIISSLEKANKTMLEDTKFRINDSSSVITSLLEKSKKHESMSVSLRTQVEKLNKEKETQEEAHKKELKKAEGEALVNRLKMEAKEKELELLRRQLARISKEKEPAASDSCVEEKKVEFENV
mmetsp:Transcript_9799/g.13845  ORF Transcript_9799/g.13845 Transcript_9799/m.13845 type:complete len:1031 (+) Transcript_9799:83-3175(+)